MKNDVWKKEKDLTTMQREINIVIADDHPVFRRGLSMIIASDPALKIVAEAGDGTEAVERIREAQPDVAVLDIDMPNRNGFDVVRQLQSLRLHPAIVFLTM